MPTRAPRPCTWPSGCRELTSGGRCAKHKPPPRLFVNRGRPTTTEQGYGWEWQKARRVFLAANPLCVMCLHDGMAIKARVVDHIKPHRGDPVLFWDETNWQSLCKAHHDEKTVFEAAERGRLGRGRSKV